MASKIENQLRAKVRKLTTWFKRANKQYTTTLRKFKFLQAQFKRHQHTKRV